MYDYLLGMIEAFVRYGMSPTALVVALVAFFRTKRFKRFLGRRIPALFRDDADVLNYQARQIRIERKLDEIAAHMGVGGGWNAGEPDYTGNTARNLLRSLWADIFRAGFANGFIRQTRSLFISRRKNQMKKWIKPDSITAIVGVLLAAVNRYFGFEIDPANILGAAVLLIGYFKANELVIVTRDAKGLPSGFRVNSRKTIFTSVGFLFVAADVALGWNLTMDTILTVVAAITGYNYLEANRDVKEAEAEGDEARQMY